MTATNEFERQDLDISADYETRLVDGVLEIRFFLEAWFDVNKKFGININEDDNAWVDMFCRYTPDDGELYIEWAIDWVWKPLDWNEYTPTDTERELIVSLLEKKIEAVEGCNFKEFCRREAKEWQELST